MLTKVTALALAGMLLALPVLAQPTGKDPMDGPPKGLETKPKARLGIDAPALNLSKVIKGSTPTLERGKIYAVEFWATWCPPCRMSIPHLTKLQEEYKDKGVTVIGISTEDPAEIQAFVQQQGDKMTYTVAADNSEKTMLNYMGAFGVKGIPHAFIVNKEGKVVWLGHPMGDLKKALAAVLDGTYDMAKTQKGIDVLALLDVYSDLAMRSDPQAKDTAERILTDGAGDAMLLGRFSAEVLQLPKPDKALALRAAEAAAQANTDNDPIVYLMYANALEQSGKKEEAIKALTKGIDYVKDQPDLKIGLQKELEEMKTRGPASSSTETSASLNDTTTSATTP